MDPQISSWGGYCVGFGAIWARLLGQLKGTAGRPCPGFPTKKYLRSHLLPPFLRLRVFS